MRMNHAQASDGQGRRLLRCISAAFARSSIGGKKTAEIKFRCSDELKDELARKANALGFHSASELGETVMSLGLLGLDHVATVQRERLERVAKLFPDGTVMAKGGRDDSAR